LDIWSEVNNEHGSTDANGSACADGEATADDVAGDVAALAEVAGAGAPVVGDEHAASNRPSPPTAINGAQRFTR
jgi:hypothetical protein